MTSRAFDPVVPANFSLPFIAWLILCFPLSGCYIDAKPLAPDAMSERLGELLEDPDPDMRRTAAEALGKIGHQSANAGLLAALSDQDARVRAAAALSLGRLGDRQSVVALIRRLADSAETVREAAALALGETEPTPTHEAQIVEALHLPETAGRIAASRALLGLDTVSFSLDLVRALRDSDPIVRQGITALLGETGDARALPHLRALVRTDAAAGVRAEAAFRLGKVGDENVLTDLETVVESDPDAVVRGWARWAVRQITQSREFGSGK